MESKYRFRWDKTGREVPKEYWEARNRDLLGGDACVPRKVDGKWLIYQKVEHDNPADYYNTCIKIGKKRAHVDATITATATSDILTQDIEDMPVVTPDYTVRSGETAQDRTGTPPKAEADRRDGEAKKFADRAAQGEPEAPAAPVTPPPAAPKPLPPTPADTSSGPKVPDNWNDAQRATISKPRCNRLYALRMKEKWTNEQFDGLLAHYGYKRDNEILVGHYNEICEKVSPGCNDKR
jgi:hypothetical protein